MAPRGPGTGRHDVEGWVRRYRRAWESNGRGDIEALFTEDARYRPEPFGEPWGGRAAIVERWLERRDEPGDTEFRFEVLAVCDGVGFVRGWTRYRSPPREYSNLWVIRMEPDGRCSEFEEWWMRRP